MAIPFIGAIIEKVIGVGGGIISKLVKDKDLAKQLDHAFRMEMESNSAEFAAMEVEAEARIFEAHQATVQAELQQSDLFTKRTRPSIARKSFYAGLLYALLTALPFDGIGIPFTETLIMPWQFEWSVLMLLYSPALTYMGVRGFEKWKAGGSA